MRCKWIGFIVLAFVSLVRAESRVMIISIDGLRPDVALRADMPKLRSLMKTGSFTFWANTTPVAVTLPSHTSMLTGCVVEKHGISGNDDKAAASEKLLVPTIFDLARKAGISTGMVAGKSKFSLFAPQVEQSWVTKGLSSDDEVAEQAVNILRQYRPRLMFVHFPHTDTVGHAQGWGTREQIASVGNTDVQLGKLLAELDSLKLRPETTIILSADHGGSGKVHGADDPRSKFIPWIINGPGIHQDTDLSQFRDLQIQTYDTFATACVILNIPLPDNIDGKPVTLAYTNVELMQIVPGK